MTAKDITASCAFQSLLKTLCLSEFPCGIGSWRNSKDKFADGQYATTMKDYGVEHEKMEVLHEYLHSGTWDVNTSWSAEAASLRQIAVSEPWRIDNKFIWKFFISLRLIDKQITEIDADMRKLENLEELTLSVNKLEKIPSDRLPPKIKALELCYNRLETVSSLCKHPPALLHLGLSYNLLSSSQDYKYFTAEFWPALMSLDLSYNDLVELVELVEKLSTLPKLQNLVLHGNPLSLIPGYRGHVVDAMKHLMILDDNHVSADEKHHFKGLGKKKELILDEAQLVIAVDYLKGVPIPNEMKDDEETPEFPVVTTTYHVKYDMLSEESETKSETAARARTTSVSWQVDSEIPEDGTSLANAERALTESSKMVTSTYKTQHVEWEDEAMDLQYKKLHLIDELVALRDFLKVGIKFSIVEEKVFHWPATPAEDHHDPPATPDAKKGKKAPGGKDTPAKKGKDTPKGKDKGGKETAKDKGRAKSEKDTRTDMRSDPPIVTEIGSCLAPLADFIEGESELKKVFHCGGGPMPAVTIDEGPTPMLEKPDTSKSAPAKGGRKKSPRPDSKNKSRKSSVGKKPSRGAEKHRPPSGDSVASEDDKLALPPPITLSVKVDLVRWKTAADSLKSPV